MKFMYNLLVISILSLFSHTTILAQSAYWQDISEMPDLVQGRSNAQKKPRYLSLDIDAVKNTLSGKSIEDVTFIIDIPMPEEGYQQFEVSPSNVMSKKLASKFPNITTFSGRGIDDPTATVKVDYGPEGLHAMVLRPDIPPIYIDPVSYDHKGVYMSYHKHDVRPSQDSSKHCSFDELEENITRSKALRSLDSKQQLTSLDNNLRTYKLAVATTFEYSRFHGGTKASVMSAIVTTLNRVNGIYERELAISLELVDNNDEIIFLTSNDPYSNNDGGQMLSQNQSTLDNIIGNGNYDIGHVFSTGGGGIASVGSVCRRQFKARGVTGLRSPIGDPFDVDYVAHEIGHQYGALHTFNNSCSDNRTPIAAFEPGSGVTIMGYAGICSPNVARRSDVMFHAYSIQQINQFVNSFGGSCARLSPLAQSIPTASAGPDHTIPKGTPFTLAGSSSGNTSGYSYSWEQFDNEIAPMPPRPSNDEGPAFRTFLPTSSPERTFPNMEAIIEGTTPEWEVLAEVGREYNFRFVVRDNVSGGGLTASDNTTLTVADNAGPFVMVLPNTAITWTTGSTSTVKWETANTENTPVNCTEVDILLSTDGGKTFPIVLADNVANDGSHDVLVPSVNTEQARIKVRAVGNVFFDISNTDFTIEGNTTNSPPVITSSPILKVKEGELYSYTVVASDRDGDALTYSATVPSWLSFDTSTGVLSGIATTTGDYPVTISVTDGTEATVQSFEIRVDELTCNGTPFPTATVTTTDISAPRAKDGTITFTFPDIPGRNVIQFSINGGRTYPFKTSDKNGSFTVKNRAANTFNLWVRWGNKDCPVDLGTYTLKVANTGAPSKVTTEEKEMTLVLYPNPVEGILYLEGPQLTEDTQFSIFDLYGRPIMKGSGLSLNTKTLTSGVYTLKINGQARFQRFMKR